MERIGDQTETVSIKPVEELYKHEREIDSEKDRDLPCIVIFKAFLKEVPP
jgi:hypothetical protein